MEKCDEFYVGKVKFVFIIDDLEWLVIVFCNDIFVFDGKKKEVLDCKGVVNNQFNVVIMEMFYEVGIFIYFEKLLSVNELLVKKLDMILVECVVCNIVVGFIVCWLGVEEGKELILFIFELFFKDDVLGDLMINEYYVCSFGWVKFEYIEKMKELIFKVNDVFKKCFLDVNMLLVDYKLEFGLFYGEVVFGDEFFLDGCWLWDKDICEKMDKDCFCQDLGNVIEVYEEVGCCLGMIFQ